MFFSLFKKKEKNKSKFISKELLEERLLEADVAYEIVEEVLFYLPPSENVERKELERVLGTYFLYESEKCEAKPFVELVLGVNGAGKTTTIAKLAHLYKSRGKSVILGACDTFRAGAVEQLKLWAKRLEVPIVATSQGHDPAAVAFDCVSSAVAKGADYAVIDTAGRLQNQKNLSLELDKISRLCARAKEGAPHRCTLVLDGTQGRAAYAQAKAFGEVVKLSGVVITKLDGSVKGGALFSVARELELPILYIGVGEKQEDLIEFDAIEFVKGLCEWIYSQ